MNRQEANELIEKATLLIGRELMYKPYIGSKHIASKYIFTEILKYKAGAVLDKKVTPDITVYGLIRKPKTQTKHALKLETIINLIEKGVD